MQNSISSEPVYIKDFYLNTLNGLFGVKGALSGYIVGLDIDPLMLSMQILDDHRVSLQLSPFHIVNLPEVGIQRSTDYDCFVGPEKKPILHFRVSSEGKTSIITAKTKFSSPNLITIMESNGSSVGLVEGILFTLKTKFLKIFGSDNQIYFF